MKAPSPQPRSRSVRGPAGGACLINTRSMMAGWRNNVLMRLRSRRVCMAPGSVAGSWSSHSGSKRRAGIMRATRVLRRMPQPLRPRRQGVRVRAAQASPAPSRKHAVAISWRHRGDRVEDRPCAHTAAACAFCRRLRSAGREGYYRIFQHARKRTDDIWQCQGKTGEPQFESELIARWDVEAAGPNWKVATHYEFLRLEHIIRAEMGAPITRHVPRTLAWILDYLITGTTWRMLRAAWRFTLHVLYFEVVLLLWLALAAGLGWLVARTAARLFALPAPVALAVGILTGIACVVMLRPVVHRLRAVQGNSCWAL